MFSFFRKGQRVNQQKKSELKTTKMRMLVWLIYKINKFPFLHNAQNLVPQCLCIYSYILHTYPPPKKRQHIILMLWSKKYMRQFLKKCSILFIKVLNLQNFTILLYIIPSFMNFYNTISIYIYIYMEREREGSNGFGMKFNSMRKKGRE